MAPKHFRRLMRCRPPQAGRGHRMIDNCQDLLQELRRENLQAGEHPLNGKLLEMTGALVRRHAAALVDGAEPSARAAKLMKRCCLPVSHIAGIQRTGRSPGGLQLRLRSAATS